MNQIEIIYPDDWHCHLRDGAYLATTVPAAAKQFKRVIVMPNLMPPITTVDSVAQYRQRILNAMPKTRGFEPLMTLYLTDAITTSEITKAKNSGFVAACKLYPQGVTTHSQAGVTSLSKLYPIFETMSEQQLPLLIHGEVNDQDIDIFDREQVFIDRHLAPLLKDFPELKIVLEHITTQEAVQFVQASGKKVAATITPHHLLLNRNAMFKGGINPHHYCLPVLKRNTHQEALIKAATSGSAKFFLGTDSAPHAKSKKENACGCAGVFNSFAAIEMYAQVFADANALDKLEGFASRFGPAFYGLPLNTETLLLNQEDQVVPQMISFGDDELVPFMAGETLRYKRAGS